MMNGSNQFKSYQEYPVVFQEWSIEQLRSKMCERFFLEDRYTMTTTTIFSRLLLLERYQSSLSSRTWFSCKATSQLDALCTNGYRWRNRVILMLIENRTEYEVLLRSRSETPRGDIRGYVTPTLITYVESSISRCYVVSYQARRTYVWASKRWFTTCHPPAERKRKVWDHIVVLVGECHWRRKK